MMVKGKLLGNEKSERKHEKVFRVFQLIFFNFSHVKNYVTQSKKRIEEKCFSSLLSNAHNIDIQRHLLETLRGFPISMLNDSKEREEIAKLNKKAPSTFLHYGDSALDNTYFLYTQDSIGCKRNITLNSIIRKEKSQTLLRSNDNF
ncbi:CLUMA_CG000271, isoform A [Clunio marinus]|uniref:CLUMA_CG000271, isoform A n=1 Tax=Clunio marinus TaxID=568069 RepID=A0A1J1HE39_9DIPT|nr:CLUMA_CG000271, isoform A [Clunio marinus]